MNVREVNKLEGNKKNLSYEKTTMEVPKRLQLQAMQQVRNCIVMEKRLETQRIEKQIREATTHEKKLLQNDNARVHQEIKRLTKKLKKTNKVEYEKLLREVMDIRIGIETLLIKATTTEEKQLRSILNNFRTDKKILEEQEKVEEIINELQKEKLKNIQKN